MGRATEGVRGMTLRGDDEVIAAEIARDDADLLVVTENGSASERASPSTRARAAAAWASRPSS